MYVKKNKIFFAAKNLLPEYVISTKVIMWVLLHDIYLLNI